MINMHALHGGGEACAAPSPTFQEGTRLLAALEDQIDRAGCPSMAYNLLIARQALESHLRYKKWIAEQAATAEDVNPAAEDAKRVRENRNAQSHFLLRRAHAVMMF